MKPAFNSKKLTDMEIALSLLRLMDDNHSPYELNEFKKTSNDKSACTMMVESAVETLTNPFAKNLLMAKLAEQGQY